MAREGYFTRRRHYNHLQRWLETYTPWSYAAARTSGIETCWRGSVFPRWFYMIIECRSLLFSDSISVPCLSLNLYLSSTSFCITSCTFKRNSSRFAVFNSSSVIRALSVCSLNYYWARLRTMIQENMKEVQGTTRLTHGSSWGLNIHQLSSSSVNISNLYLKFPIIFAQTAVLHTSLILVLPCHVFLNGYFK